MEQYLTQNFFQTELQILNKTCKTTVVFMSYHISKNIYLFRSIIKNLVLKIKTHFELKKTNCFPRSPTF